MSARDDLAYAVTPELNGPGANQLIDAYRDEVLAEHGATRSGQGRLQRALLFALNWHGRSPAELHAGINKILTEDGDR